MKHNKWLIFLVLVSLLIVNSGSVLAQEPLPPGNSASLPKSAFGIPMAGSINTAGVGPMVATPVIVNGNFEQGSGIGWGESSTHGWQLVNSLLPVPPIGSWSAWLGGDNLDTSTISQSNITISSPTYLHLSYWIGSEDVCGFDWGSLYINATSMYSWSLCNSNNTNGWVDLNLDLSAFNGQTVTLSITAVTDDTLNSNLFIDDVYLYDTFADVPYNGFAWSQIKSIYAAGITAGCATSPLKYCPDNPVTRAQMAVFLLRGIHTSAYTPPAPTGTAFGDVPTSAFAASWIEQMSIEGITSGCGAGNFCPNNSVTRAQMAVFLLRAKYGSAYTPPTATGTIFGDVPFNAFAAAWIEQMVTEGITSGCGGGNYCPDSPVTRAQMAVFLQRTFSLP